MARIVLEGFGARMDLRQGNSELAGATVERALTAGACDRRWRASTTPSAITDALRGIVPLHSVCQRIRASFREPCSGFALRKPPTTRI